MHFYDQVYTRYQNCFSFCVPISHRSLIHSMPIHEMRNYFEKIITSSAHPMDSLTFFWKNTTAFWDRKKLKIVSDVLLLNSTGYSQNFIQYYLLVSWLAFVTESAEADFNSIHYILNINLQLEHWWSGGVGLLFAHQHTHNLRIPVIHASLCTS